MIVNIVLGGSGYLGRSLVTALESSGAKTLHFDKANPDHPIDLSDGVALGEVLRESLNNLPRLVEIRMAVTAGYSVFTESLDRTKKEIDDVISANVTLPIMALNSLLKICQEKGVPGSMVLTSSVFAHRVPNFSNYAALSRRNSEIYGASKAALEQLTRYYAVSLGISGIRVNAVAPGGIYDPEIHSDDFVKKYSRDTALGRMTRVEEVISAIKFLLGPDSSGITGQVLRVDSGFKL